jgi:hypothetical protein
MTVLPETKHDRLNRAIIVAIQRAAIVLIVLIFIGLIQAFRYGFAARDYLFLLVGSIVSIAAMALYAWLPSPKGAMMLVIWGCGFLPLAFLIYVAGYHGLWSLTELRNGLTIRPFIKALIFGYLGWSAARHFAKVTNLVRQRDQSLAQPPA